MNNSEGGRNIFPEDILGGPIAKSIGTQGNVWSTIYTSGVKDIINLPKGLVTTNTCINWG